MSAFLRPNKRPRRRASAVSATRVMPTNASAAHKVKRFITTSPLELARVPGRDSPCPTDAGAVDSDSESSIRGGERQNLYRRRKVDGGAMSSRPRNHI